MAKKGDRRVQIKTIKLQIKKALLSDQDPVPFFIAS